MTTITREGEVTVPLPGGYADKLLRHLGTCEICRAAKSDRKTRKCPEGRALLRATLEERFGGIQ